MAEVDACQISRVIPEADKGLVGHHVPIQRTEVDVVADRIDDKNRKDNDARQQIDNHTAKKRPFI
jgi:hypothetical protein